MRRAQALRIVCLAAAEKRLAEVRDLVRYLTNLERDRAELARQEPKVWADEAKKVARNLAAARKEAKTWKAVRAALK